MKKYEIFSLADYEAFNDKINFYFKCSSQLKREFKRFTIVTKEWRRDRSPKQLRYFWSIIGEARKAFLDSGNEFTKDEIASFFKKEHGFTKRVILANGNTIEINKSLSNCSEDADVKSVIELTDYIIRWVAVNLNYVIEPPEVGE